MAAIYVLEDGAGTMYYTHTDYLGSLTVLSDQSGGEFEIYAYDPWGKRRNPSDWTLTDNRTNLIFNRGYTMHEHLDEFNLINMNGRVYDPLVARFLSPDPYVQSPDVWMNYNRYAYCYNNPMIYTDPSGEWFWFAIAAGAMLGGSVGGAAAEGWEMNPSKWAWDGDTWAGIGLGAVVGGAAGVGFYYAAPALSETSIFAHFGTSGTIAAYTLTGGVAGGLAGYGAGLSGGLLFSNGDWGDAHQSGMHGARLGATIGSLAGAMGGMLRTYQPPQSSKTSNQMSRIELEPLPEPTLDGIGRAENISSRSPSIEIGGLKSNARTPRSYYERAQLYEEVPYFYGGTSAAGIDCSGLVTLSTQSSNRWFTSSGTPPPGNWSPVSYTHSRSGFTKTARSGVLLFWPKRHAAFYSGAGGRIFHAHGSKGTPTGYTNDLFSWWIPNRGYPSIYRQNR